MIKNLFSLNLRQFDGDGASDTSGTDQTDAFEQEYGYQESFADTGDTADQQITAQTAAESTKTEEGTETSEDLDKEFNELIKGKFKEQFQARQERAIRSRLKASEADRETIAQGEQLRAKIAARYGLEDASMEDVLAAVDGDDTLLEDAAAQAGLSTAQYKAMSDAKQAAAEAKAELEANRRAAMEEEFNRKLAREEEVCRKSFPDFDFMTEKENPQFTNLLKSGVKMIDAYKFAHMDELMANGMATAASKGAAATAAAVRNNLSRPAEAGIRGSAAVSANLDFGKMSDEDFAKYQAEIMGEI